MEQDIGVQGDSYYDPQVDLVITRSGKARWRRRLADAEARRDPEAFEELRAQLRLGPAANA